MSVYGFKDNKCKAELPTVFADLTDEFSGGTYSDAPNISTVGNNMPENSIAYYHVNSSGFPGSGNGTIIAFKAKGGTYKNYMFFDTTNNEFYAMAADGTSKTWTRLCSVGTVYEETISVAANESEVITFDNETQFTSKTAYTTDMRFYKTGTAVAAKATANVYFGDSYYGLYAQVYNLSDTAIDVTIRVLMLS